MPNIPPSNTCLLLFYLLLFTLFPFDNPSPFIFYTELSDCFSTVDPLLTTLIPPLLIDTDLWLLLLLFVIDDYPSLFRLLLWLSLITCSLFVLCCCCLLLYDWVDDNDGLVLDGWLMFCVDDCEGDCWKALLCLFGLDDNIEVLPETICDSAYCASCP